MERLKGSRVLGVGSLGEIREISDKEVRGVREKKRYVEKTKLNQQDVIKKKSTERHSLFPVLRSGDGWL